MDKKDYISPEMKIKLIDFRDILTESVNTGKTYEGEWLAGDPYDENNV